MSKAKEPTLDHCILSDEFWDFQRRDGIIDSVGRGAITQPPDIAAAQKLGSHCGTGSLQERILADAYVKAKEYGRLFFGLSA
ncbi:MAG: hypothetical protein EOS41_04540 [Mesorhizobium sp.]|uniref:hypothetical protein n=1 Tax=Mesorhizobium sp. TaxID=1871066 RepID=UPI000FE74079|nr:hypothetical protein [Mesorhizobium sp.]RWE27094.1 MAG: hypothetical protein EOS41_04540 [Mesorhizobium sp.]